MGRMLQPALFDEDGLLDPAGDGLCRSMTGEERRQQGITLTPTWLVDAMLQAVQRRGPFDNIVDAGAGTGRFCMRAAQLFPHARIWAVERSADMAEVLRSNLAAASLSHRVCVIQADFREAELPLLGRTAFVGNPPFVRHHDIAPVWKQWYGSVLAGWGKKASQLAGLHLHFLARITQLARPGDLLSLVTSAEWLDNGYGTPWRELLSASQGPISLQGLWVAPSDEAVFPDALVSAVVLEAACHAAGTGVDLGLVTKGGLEILRELPRERLAAQTRWTSACQRQLEIPVQGTELGALFRVTRGQVTGNNKAWVLPQGSALLPQRLTLPTVTKAREIIDGTVTAPDALQRLRRVPNLPVDLAVLPAADQRLADQYLAQLRAMGAAEGYVAGQRRAWYALDLRSAPAALVSYMGRRPPVFRTNPHAVSFLNIAHGLYPRQTLSDAQMASLLGYLNTHTSMAAGRIYGGGMAKFEPSDISRLRVPAHIFERM